MNTYLKYEVIQAYSATEIEKKVALAITRGAKPQGGLSVTARYGDIREQFFQAMVTEVKQKEPTHITPKMVQEFAKQNQAKA